MLTPISVKKFADMVMKNDKGYDRKDLIQSLWAALEAKKSGAPFWAAGSAITGLN